MERIYAMLSAQGTACGETALYESEYTAMNRKRMEDLYCNRDDEDAPVRDTWTDVTDNEAIHG